MVAKATLAAPVHYELARVYAVASVAGDDEASLEPNTRATWTESLAEQAMTHLKSAQRRGFFGDPKQVLRLSRDPEWAEFGSRAGFRAFREDLAFPINAFALTGLFAIVAIGQCSRWPVFPSARHLRLGDLRHLKQ